MNKFIYHVKSALKPRMRNIISILSLSLGLALSLVVFANIVYDRSYDNFHEDKDRMYVVRPYFISDDKEGWGHWVPDIVVPTLITEAPVVEKGTYFRPARSVYAIENNEVSVTSLIIDTCFFDVFNFQVIDGNPSEDFKDISTIYLSKSKAYDLFGNESPIGKVVENAERRQRVVRGIYNDFPENSMIHFQFGTIDGLESMAQFKVRDMWYGGDRNIGVIALREGITEIEAETEIKTLIDTKYDPVRAEAENMVVEYVLVPIADVYANSPDIVQWSLIMSFIALFLILVSVLNYALIAVSSISLRLKEIAVRKCNGASERQILANVTMETTIHTIVALLLAVVLIFAFQDYIEEFFVPVDVVFRLENISYLLIVVPLIIVFSTIIPAKIFAKIPIISLFVKSVNRRQMWKKVMLFLQFLCAVTILSLSVMLLRQYDYVLNRDIGYEYENLVHTEIRLRNIAEIDKYYDEITSLSCVESVSHAECRLMSWLPGVFIYEGGEMVLNPRANFATATLFENIEVEFVEGASFDNNSGVADVVVNEKFVEMMNWSEDEMVVGKMVDDSDSGSLRIVGVVKNFEVEGDMRNSVAVPFVIFNLYSLPKVNPTLFNSPLPVVMNIELNAITAENLSSIENIITEIDPNANNISIQPYTAVREHLLVGYEKYVVGMNAGGILILIISAMGLYGYISNELQFKHREIALRKVYGSSIPNIILMVYKPIFNILCTAVLLGVPLSYYTGNLVLSMNFADVVPMPWWLFVVTSLFVMLFSLTIVGLRSIKIATRNPIKAIRE